MNMPASEQNAQRSPDAKVYAKVYEKADPKVYPELRVCGVEVRHRSRLALVADTASRAGTWWVGLFLAALLLAQNAMAQNPAQGPGPTAAPQTSGQIKPATPSKPASPAASGVRKGEFGPTWQELTPAQQASLKPLVANWSAIGEAQKRKWIAVSKNYAALPAPEQAKLHSRMTEWTSLSQQQRTQARLNFAETKNLSPSDKTANWQEYQALSPQDRQKLAAEAAPKPAGAAAAVKPVAPQKLAIVPAPRVDTKHAGTGALGLNGNTGVDRNTLLPRPPFTEDPLVRKN